jgi:hypothetical protein
VSTKNHTKTPVAQFLQIMLLGNIMGSHLIWLLAPLFETFAVGTKTLHLLFQIKRAAMSLFSRMDCTIAAWSFCALSMADWQNTPVTAWVCGLCEVNGPQVDRALVKGSRRSRCQHDHTKETNGRRPPKRPHNPNKKGEKTTKQNQPTGQPHTGTDQKPTPAGADRRQERTRTPHPPAQGRKAPMASRMLGEQASKQVNHGHATR